MPETTAERTRPAPVLVAGILVFSIAVIVLVLAVARGNVATQSTLADGPVFLGSDDFESGFDAGTGVTTTLESGTHGIWMSGSDIPNPEDVAIVGPDDIPVAARDHASMVTMASFRDTADLTLLLAFDAPIDGSYTIAATDTAPTAVFVVGPAHAVSPSFLATTAAVAALGLALVLVGLAQHWRKRSSRPPSRTDGAVLS